MPTKKRPELELTEYREEKDIDAILFEFKPPKKCKFDGVEMFPGRLTVRIRRGRHFVPEAEE